MVQEPNRATLDVRREIRRCPTCARRFSRDASFCPFCGERLVAGAFDAVADALLHSVVDGRYEVLEVLGEGGMGRVYKVRHQSLGRTFAMKVLRRDLAGDEELAARFLREARATAAVKHAGIVEITDFGQTAEGLPFFAMEMLEGQTLGQLIAAGGPLPAGPAARIVRHVAMALGAAHEAGVVHRDLKPDNVFLLGDVLGPSVEIRVVDFGAAKIIGSSRITRTGVVFGTPHYMSPEQASGREIDHRADIYALGVVMYEAFTGRVPFEADTYMGVLTQHMFVTPLPPSQVTAAARELGALEEITLRCLEKDPGRRFASMEDLAGALDRAVRFRDDGSAEVAPRSSRRPPRRARLAIADELEPPGVDETRVAAHRGGRRARIAAWVLAGTSVLAVCAAVVLSRGAARSSRSPSEDRNSPVRGERPPLPSSSPPDLKLATSPGAPPATLEAPPPAVASLAEPPAPVASHPPSRSAPRATAEAGAPRAPSSVTPVDDVGDPFATKL